MITLPIWLFVLMVVLFLGSLLGMWSATIATRLNRLHIRTDAARINLEGALRARAAVISAKQPELSGVVTQVISIPLRTGAMGARSDAENALLHRVDEAVTRDPVFADVSARVDLASRFYNDAVNDTLSVRARPIVKVLRLAGRAPLPEFYEAMTTTQLHV